MTDPGRSGVWHGMAAYLIWGAMPWYFGRLAPADAGEILAHRIFWSALLCLVAVVLAGRASSLARALRSWRRLALVGAAAVLIAANWTIYLIAVTSGRVAEAALGYFLNPLVSVGLGLVVLGERLRPLQWAAVGTGAAGAAYLSLAAGGPSWIALGLAVSFGLYGLLKKRIGVNLDAVQGLTAETVLLAPLAGAALAWMAATGTATVTSYGVGHAALLASTGVATAAPLVLFAAAARRVSLVTVGLLQFIAPVLQFLTALAWGEPMTPARWVGFATVWSALVILVVDVVRHYRSRPRGAAALAAAAPGAPSAAGRAVG